MNSNDINSSSIDESLFDLSLGDVPNTSALQLRILDETQNLPQLNEQKQHIHKQQGSNVSFFKRLIEPKFVGAFAIAASIALVAVLWVPNMDGKSLNQVDANLFTSEDDLDFQETMILFDEQIFAQL